MTGNAAKRRWNVRKCWSARIVVGARTATCFPSSTALKAARIATSVLPYPTSPQRSRSIGLLRLHVPLDVGDRLRLVGRLDVLERVLELLLPRRVLREREAVGEAAAGVELQQLVGHVPHGLLDRRLPLRPARAAQPVERRLDAFDAGVLLDEVEALDGEEERLLVRVADLHELALFPFDGNALQALEDRRFRSRGARRRRRASSPEDRRGKPRRGGAATSRPASLRRRSRSPNRRTPGARASGSRRRSRPAR